MLDGDAAAQCGDPVDVPRRDGLGVVEEPVEASQRRIAVHALEHIQRARDGLVVGGVQAERPAVLRQEADHRLELGLHRRREVGTRLAEVLEVGGREDEHLAGAVVAQEGVTVAGLDQLGPAQEVVLLLLWPSG